MKPVIFGEDLMLATSPDQNAEASIFTADVPWKPGRIDLEIARSCTWQRMPALHTKTLRMPTSKIGHQRVRKLTLRFAMPALLRKHRPGGERP
ncbi:hypothetical protein [Xanthomonas medicagonis]|uniref:hypothetical protein n=1 Tax=Xanthomonas medicagonis TaxID=3160841 RepID=UPI00351326A8